VWVNGAASVANISVTPRLLASPLNARSQLGAGVSTASTRPTSRYAPKPVPKAGQTAAQLRSAPDFQAGLQMYAIRCSRGSSLASLTAVTTAALTERFPSLHGRASRATALRRKPQPAWAAAAAKTYDFSGIYGMVTISRLGFQQKKWIGLVCPQYAWKPTGARCRERSPACLNGFASPSTYLWSRSPRLPSAAVCSRRRSCRRGDRIDYHPHDSVAVARPPPRTNKTTFRSPNGALSRARTRRSTSGSIRSRRLMIAKNVLGLNRAHE